MEDGLNITVVRKKIALFENWDSEIFMVAATVDEKSLERTLGLTQVDAAKGNEISTSTAWENWTVMMMIMIICTKENRTHLCQQALR